MRIRFYIIIFLLNFCFTDFAALGQTDQETTIHKIKEQIEDANHDSIRINLYLEWDKLISYTDPKKRIELNNNIINIAKKNLNNKNLKEIEKKYFTSKLAKGNNNLGVSYSLEGDYNKSLSYYQKAITIYREIKSLGGEAASIANIGIIYELQSKFELAEKYYHESLSIYEKINDKRGLSDSYNNLGNLNYFRGESEKSLAFYKKALVLKKELNELKGISQNLNNIGVIYMDLGKFDSALIYYNESLQIKYKSGDKPGIAASYNNLGTVYHRMNDQKMARYYQNKCLEVAKEIHHIEQIRNAYFTLTVIDSAERKFSDALQNYKLYIIYRDSMTNLENREKLLEQEMQFKFNVEKAKDSVKNARQIELDQIRIDKQQAEIRAKKTQQYYLFGGLGIFLIFSIFIFNRYRITRQQKKIIEHQKSEVESQKEEILEAKHLVDEKNKEITDSINYAKRIQYTLLAHDEFLKENLPEYFVFFKPKDIVSGDFYWATKKNNNFYLAVCDSTGHGVPGAFMSLLNISFLNEAITEKNISQPNEVLNHVRTRLIDNLDGGKDGMDAIMIKFQFGSEKSEENKITYAAANNKPLLIRNNSIQELQADKMPVGEGILSAPFTLHEVTLEKNDLLILLTDGFCDQFGGPKGKKFGYNNFKKFLEEHANEDLKTLNQNLQVAFQNWKGSLEQIDDVCIIGIRV